MEELLRKAQRGDEKAFLELFSMYENQMYRVAFLHVKNEADALDVMQEVAYHMFKNIRSVKNAEYFKTWLTRITMNCAVDHIRKNSKGDFITTKPHGNGIGVNSAKKIVERYGGIFNADKKENVFCVSFMLNL